MNPIDFALVYVGLAAIGRMPVGRVADYTDARALIDIGAADLIRPAPSVSSDEARADLLAYLARVAS